MGGVHGGTLEAKYERAIAFVRDKLNSMRAKVLELEDRAEELSASRQWLSSNSEKLLDKADRLKGQIEQFENLLRDLGEIP